MIVSVISVGNELLNGDTLNTNLAYLGERLANAGQLKAHCHDGFWQCMDTYREQQLLEGLWRSGNAPWKVW